MRIVVFAPLHDDVCASKQLVVNLKTEFRKLMPKIKHRHFDGAADKKLVDEIVA